MDPSRWKRISELFAAARLLHGEERLTFLKKDCGDDQDLFEEVNSLCEIDDKRGLLDSTPTVSALNTAQIIGGRFRIIRYIAEGGMGTVYEAEDVTLHDRVALKTIRSDIASDPKIVERFKREIILGKKVTHPNVCRIHDLGVERLADGTEFLFLTMQFLSGETLASRIKRGPIPKAEAQPLVEDMADALSAAHQAEVIHRDFKSGNVILVRGASRTCAVVTDFGLARGIHDDGSLHGGIVGTIDYMAPEQLRGEQVTPAADIYALGVVMYEMVTGQRPFTTDSNGTVAQKHLNDEPKPPRELAAHLESNWDEAILGCLKKHPGERFQSAGEVKAALVSNGSSLRRRPSGATSKRAMSPRLIALSAAFSLAVIVLGAIPSVRHKVEGWLHMGTVPHVGQLAVLPLMVPTDDPQSAALEYGLADTLATRLTKLVGTRPLQIVPASEIRAKGVTSLEQARQEFGVNLGLELSLRRSGDMVRVNYNLVDATTHHEIRGDTITAPMSDGFAIEDKVADSVVEAMELDLKPQEQRALTEHGTQQSAAYDLYLQGRGYLEEYQKPENVESAITVFTHALEEDPQYALALSGLGEAYWRKYELSKDKSVAMLAESTCERAVTIGGNQADTHICLGLIDHGTGKYTEAVEQYRLALQFEPANDTAIRGLASAYLALGNATEAETTYKSAIATRPGYWLGYNELGKLYIVTGRYQQAVEMFTEVTKHTPDSFRGYSNLGGAYAALGRNSEAASSFRHSIEIRPTYAAYSNLGTALFRLKRYSDAAENYKAALNLNGRDYLVWGNLADAYRYSGKQPEATAASEKAISLALAALEINGSDPLAHVNLAMYYADLGKRDKALAHLTAALDQSKYRDPDVIFDAAVVYHTLGNNDESIKWVGTALKAGYSPAAALSAPSLEGLHSDPRFESLIRTATHGQS